MSDDAALIWSAVLSITNLAVFVLAGRVSRRLRLAAWWLTIITEPLWAIFGYLTGGWFFVALAAFYTAVAVWNLHTMRGETRSERADYTVR
jgi:hypothetical protein